MIRHAVPPASQYAIEYCDQVCHGGGHFIFCTRKLFGTGSSPPRLLDPMTGEWAIASWVATKMLAGVTKRQDDMLVVPLASGYHEPWHDGEGSERVKIAALNYRPRGRGRVGWVEAGKERMLALAGFEKEKNTPYFQHVEVCLIPRDQKIGVGSDMVPFPRAYYTLGRLDPFDRFRSDNRLPAGSDYQLGAWADGYYVLRSDPYFGKTRHVLKLYSRKAKQTAYYENCFGGLGAPLITDIAISPCGRTFALAGGTENSALRLYDVDNMDWPKAIFNVPAYRVCFSSDGLTLAGLSPPQHNGQENTMAVTIWDMD